MVAIYAMISNPFHFETWINYHFSIGVDYIFLRIEDTPDLEENLKKYPNVIASFEKDVDTTNNYWTIQKRQVEFFNNIKSKLIELKIEWLFANIDCDELLCCENIKDIIKNIPLKYEVAHITNFEAIYSNDQVENPFTETNTFRYNDYLAYGNGKTGVRINKNTQILGPHLFKGKHVKLPSNKICILHYESSNFQRWYNKFKSYINSDNESIEKIPFSFYKESIKIIRERSIDEARKYYNHNKVHINDNIIRLYWTPLMEQKNICWG